MFLHLWLLKPPASFPLPIPSSTCRIPISVPSPQPVQLHSMIVCSLYHCSLAATFSALDEGSVSPLPKRAKPTYLAMDKENQIIGYVVPIFRGR